MSQSKIQYIDSIESIAPNGLVLKITACHIGEAIGENGEPIETETIEADVTFGYVPTDHHGASFQAACQLLRRFDEWGDDERAFLVAALPDISAHSYMRDWLRTEENYDVLDGVLKDYIDSALGGPQTSG